MIVVRCTSCHTQYRVDLARLGEGRRKVKCARCGTIFPVEDPRVAAPADPLATPLPAPRAPAPEKPGPRLNVAVLGLEAGTRRQAAIAALARCGVRATSADDGPGVVDAARRTRPTLVVVPLWLRALGAAEVIETLRSEPHSAAARFVVVGLPPRAGRQAPPAERVLDADAVVPSLDDPAFEAAVRTLLDLPGAPPPAAASADSLAASARLAVGDLLACEGGLVDDALRSGRAGAELAEQVAASREWCASRHDALARRGAEARAAFDAAWSSALSKRRRDLGLGDGPLPA